MVIGLEDLNRWSIAGAIFLFLILLEFSILSNQKINSHKTSEFLSPNLGKRGERKNEYKKKEKEEWRKEAVKGDGRGAEISWLLVI